MVIALRTRTSFSAGLPVPAGTPSGAAPLLIAIVTSPSVLPSMTVNRLVSLNWSIVSGACRLEMMSS